MELQLTIWDILDKLSVAPADTELNVVWECLDSELLLLTIEQQLEALVSEIQTVVIWMTGEESRLL